MLKYTVYSVTKEIKETIAGLQESYTIVCVSSQNGTMTLEGLTHEQSVNFSVNKELSIDPFYSQAQLA